MRNSGDGSYELVARNLAIGAMKKALFANCGVVAKGGLDVSDVDRRILQGEIQRENEMLEQWKRDNGFEVEAPDDVETAEVRAGQWISVLHECFANGVALPQTFSEVLATQERYARSPDLSYRVADLVKLHEAYGESYTEAELLEDAGRDAKKWCEFLSVHGGDAKALCEAQMYGKRVEFDEPTGWDRFVLESVRKSIRFAWNGVKRGNPVASSNYGILKTYQA
jgi:hypothetical protein